MKIKSLLKKSFSSKGLALSLSKGFTLIELLIVITIISALAVTVFVALNPAQRLKDARDARRTSDVDSILTAIHTSIVDNKGALPTNLTASAERQLGTGTSTDCTTALVAKGCNTPAATACSDLMTGANNLTKYLKSMVIDPTGGTTYTALKTGYSVNVDANNLVTITACGAEGSGNVQASR